MVRGLELGQHAALRVRPRRGPVAARGAQRDASAPTCARLVRGTLARPCARVLAWCARCFGTLGTLVYP
jgi:hypothetical protein